jgi:hypothetical protein
MRRFRFSNTWRLYPAHSQVPVTLQHDLSFAAAADLLKIFGCTVPKLAADKSKHIRAIQDLTAIMAGQRAAPPTVDAPSARVIAPCPRVVTTPPPRVATISNNITTPNAIRQMPLNHQRQTCNNNPFHILSDNNDDDDTVVTSNCSPSASPTIPLSSIPPVSTYSARAVPSSEPTTNPSYYCPTEAPTHQPAT